MERTLEEALTCPRCQEVFLDPRQPGPGLPGKASAPLRGASLPNFSPVIGIKKNYTVSSITGAYQEAWSTVGPPHPHPDLTRFGLGLVYSHCCLDKRSLAVKTCVQIEVSLCGEHVKEHLELVPLVKPLRDVSKGKFPRAPGPGREIRDLCTLESKRPAEPDQAGFQHPQDSAQCEPGTIRF